MRISRRMDSTRASSLMGRTMPDVPRIEMPPSMPRRGLKVLRAISSPPGTDTSTAKPPCQPCSRAIRSSSEAIIARGTELMAAAPTGWSSPARVTRPTPAPPSIVVPGVFTRLTRTTTSAPSVASASSPASLRTPQLAQGVPCASVPRCISSGSTTTAMPAGVSMRREWGKFPARSACPQAWAAAAAQVPVV